VHHDASMTVFDGQDFAYVLRVLGPRLRARRTR
jgi:hypothetical protein